MTTNEALAALAKSRPIRTAIYSASLLVVGNWRWTAHSVKSPSGDRRTPPTPSVCWLDKLSIHIVHGAGPLSSSSFAVNLVTKSAKAWALIVVCGWYSMSNSSSSIAHKTNRSTDSGLFIAFRNGLSVWTTMVCA